MRYAVKTNSDLDNLLGAKLGKAIRELRAETWQRLPRTVQVMAEKPEFYLNDGDTLHAYGIDLINGTIESTMYCGSGDTAINHGREQFSRGYQPPDNTALLFVQTYWNGRNTSWTLTIVSKNLNPSLTA